MCCHFSKKLICKLFNLLVFFPAGKVKSLLLLRRAGQVDSYYAVTANAIESKRPYNYLLLLSSHVLFFVWHDDDEKKQATSNWVLPDISERNIKSTILLFYLFIDFQQLTRSSILLSFMSPFLHTRTAPVEWETRSQIASRQ